MAVCAERHASNSASVYGRSEKAMLPSFLWAPTRLVYIMKNNPFDVQLESQITISFFFSSNGASFVRRSRHGGLETAELLNPCVTAIVVGKKLE